MPHLNADSGRFWTRDLFEGVNYDPGSLHKYLFSGVDPINFWDPSGFETLVSQQSGLTIATRMGRTVISYTTRAGRRVAKVIACGTGVIAFRQATLEQLDLFNPEGHHGKAQVFGGPVKQPLVFLDRILHKSLHKAINAFLQVGGLLPENVGADKWKVLLQTPATKRAAYAVNLRAARLIDRVCKLKGPYSLAKFTRDMWQQNGGVPKK